MSKMLTKTKRKNPFTLLSEIVPEILLEKVIMIRLIKKKKQEGDIRRNKMVSNAGIQKKSAYEPSELSIERKPPQEAPSNLQAEATWNFTLHVRKPCQN